MTKRIVKYPFGPADVKTLTYAATIAMDVENAKTIATVALTGAATINATIKQGVEPGDEVVIKASADGTSRALTFGTGFTLEPYTVTANKNVVITLVYDGVTFRGKSILQLD